MTARSGRNLSKVQERYKRYFDRKVRFTPTFSTGDLVYVNKPPTSAKTQAEQLSGLPRSKMLPKTTGPHRVIYSDGHTVAICEDEIRNTVSIDQVTLTPEIRVASGTNGAQTDQSDTGATSSDARNAPTEGVVSAEKEDGEQVRSVPQSEEFVVDKIVGRVKKDGLVHYTVRWFGCGKADDTTEPSEHIPEHFIVRYWDKLRRARRQY